MDAYMYFLYRMNLIPLMAIMQFIKTHLRVRNAIIPVQEKALFKIN